MKRGLSESGRNGAWAGNNQDDVAGEFGERKKRGANAVGPSKILPPVETKGRKARSDNI